MKFCPNCGSILEGKLKCNCGYNVETGEVDKDEYQSFKEREKSLYEQSSDNISMMGMANQYDVVDGAKMMGINPNLSNEEILSQFNQPIFNKDNDNLSGEELLKILKQNDHNKKDKE